MKKMSHEYENVITTNCLLRNFATSIRGNIQSNGLNGHLGIIQRCKESTKVKKKTKQYHLINEAMLPQNMRNYMDDQKSTKSLML